MRADEKLHQKIEDYAFEHGLDYARAFERVVAQNPELAEQYAETTTAVEFQERRAAQPQLAREFTQRIKDRRKAGDELHRLAEQHAREHGVDYTQALDYMIQHNPGLALSYAR